MENKCICCGRIIPDGTLLCLHCGDYDDMQVFKDAKREECEECEDSERERIPEAVP